MAGCSSSRISEQVRDTADTDRGSEEAPVKSLALGAAVGSGPAPRAAPTAEGAGACGGGEAEPRLCAVGSEAGTGAGTGPWPSWSTAEMEGGATGSGREDGAAGGGGGAAGSGLPRAHCVAAAAWSGAGEGGSVRRGSGVKVQVSAGSVCGAEGVEAGTASVAGPVDCGMGLLVCPGAAGLSPSCGDGAACRGSGTAGSPSAGIEIGTVTGSLGACTVAGAGVGCVCGGAGQSSGVAPRPPL